MTAQAERQRVFDEPSIDSSRIQCSGCDKYILIDPDHDCDAFMPCANAPDGIVYCCEWTCPYCSQRHTSEW